jgi:phosphoglycolate phosphatase
MFKDATIVFDLDGTLVDTAPDLSNALNDVLTRRGHQPVSPETIRACIGHGARVMIEEALRRAGAQYDVDRMLDEFLVHYEANIAAVAALEAFAAQGAILAVCTNKRESLSRRLLHELGIDGYFAAIAGRDTFAVSKPDPGHLTGTIALAGGDPSHAVMIGDSEVDVSTAKAAGIPIILVSFGYATAPLHGLSPDAMIDHFDALAAHAAALLNGVAHGRSQGLNA